MGVASEGLCLLNAWKTGNSISISILSNKGKEIEDSNNNK